ncbi:MAG: hypothetical protein II474_02805 [Firmicutes bacterium]|nr:hypothetical protein [Bacillota bacterium]
MKSKFWRIYLVYVAVILAALAALHFYVKGIMVRYENQDPVRYVGELLQEASEKDGKLDQFLEEHAFNGPAGAMTASKDRFYGVLQSLQGADAAQLEIVEDPAHVGSTDPVVNVNANGKPFLRVALHEAAKTTKLLIMTISDWDISSAVLLDPDRDAAAPLPVGEDGLLNYSVEIPEGFTLLLDGTPVSADVPYSEASLPEFEYVAPFAEVPSGLLYDLKGLALEPKISALNNAGQEVAAVQTAPGVYSVPSNFAETQEAMDKMAQIADPLYIGELWSQFMTDDVAGSYHGFYTVVRECKLLEGSNLYDLAENWADSVDITFVSNHVITAWNKESISNYIQYSDDLLSCDVYFEKEMRVAGQQRIDVFDNRMYFVNLDGTWYLADMLSLAGTH